MRIFSREKSKKEEPGEQLPLKGPDHVVTLTAENFDEFIKKYTLCLVDFWAPWCAPCKTMIPRLRRLEQVYKRRVAFARLNTEEHQKIARKYNIMGIPHFIFFHKGKKVGELTGVKSVGEMKETIDKLLKKYE